MQIERIRMSRPHYQAGRPGPVRMVVLHATAGRSPSDLNWLRAGGDERRPVSVHYYIDKRGRVVQLVDDGDTAWHAGQSRWVVDGREVSGCNPISIGIELENLNTGRDPYPAAQYAAALWLCRRLIERYSIPSGQFVRHLDIAPGRKTDPAGFPWEQFRSEAYTDLGAPGSDQPPPADQLRARLLDLAFRAAGGAITAKWPLFDRAQGWKLGMPIAIPSGGQQRAAAGAAQDDHDRTLRLGEQGRFLVEIYARDLLYVPADGGASEPSDLSRIRRLSQAPSGPLRDALLDVLFRQADPLNGFRADWAFHQHFLADASSLGVPIGPSQRLRSADKEYVYQHFSLDSLCSPVDNWKTIYRLSALAHAQPGLTRAGAEQLQRLLLDSLYREHAGRQYAPDAALVRYARENSLGAPLGRPELAEIGEAHVLMMPYALDVIACHLPSPDWPFDRPLPAGASVQRLNTTLGAGQPDLELSRLSAPGARFALPAVSAYMPLLGPDWHRPVVHDLSLSSGGGVRRVTAAIESLLLAPVPGPPARDLSTSPLPWHYYVAQDGRVLRLRDAHLALPSTVEASPQLARLARRAVVLAVEGDPATVMQPQRTALIWLIQLLRAELQISPAQIHVLPRLHASTPQPQASSEGAIR